MEMKTNTSKVLMSETLKGQINELDQELYDDLINNGVFVTIKYQSITDKKEVSGVLRSVLFDETPELELRIEISSALSIVKTNNLTISNFQLQHGEIETVDVPGPFIVKAARIEDLDVPNQLCVLSLQLIRSKRS